MYPSYVGSVWMREIKEGDDNLVGLQNPAHKMHCLANSEIGLRKPGILGRDLNE